MFCVFTEVMAQDDKLLLTRTTFSALDQSYYAFMRYRLYSKQKVL